MAPSSLFDSFMTDGSLVGSPSLPPLNLNHPSPGSTSSIEIKHEQPSQTSIESLINSNNSLTTRVKELELVNDMFRTRLHQLEQSESNLKRGAVNNREVEAQLRLRIEEFGRREESLKRRVEELESELVDSSSRKKLRVSDITV